MVVQEYSIHLILAFHIRVEVSVDESRVILQTLHLLHVLLQLLIHLSELSMLKDLVNRLVEHPTLLLL